MAQTSTPRRSVTTITVPAKGRRPERYIVSGIFGTGRREYTDRKQAANYALLLSTCAA